MALPATHKSALKALCSSFLEAQPNVLVNSPLSWEDEWLEAKFNVQVDGIALDIYMRMPIDFPMNRAQYICPARSNTAHCLESGKVCVIPAFCPDAEEQLQEDFDCLLRWMREFVIPEKPALRYAYPSLPRLPIYMVFCEGQRDHDLHKGDCGTFKYSKVYPFEEIANKARPTGIALEIAGKKADWVDSYKAAQKFEGAWIYIQDEPRDYNGALVTNASQLDSIFTSRLKKEIKSIRAANKPRMFETLFPGHFPLMVGYDINHGELTEIHWEMMLLTIMAEDELDANRKLAAVLGIHLPKFEGPTPILWGDTLNASYDRFFGRGKLENQLTQARIMIIGVGAIGGTLADMLVRGGCQHLTLVDYDLIKPGNVCRSVYPFLAMNRPKVTYLLDALRNTSPFVNLRTFDMLPMLRREDPRFEELKKELAQYDMIFDCSATHQVAWMLDQMEIDARILNISVTDEAKELLLVAGQGSILQQKEDYLMQLGSHAEPSYYEGLGCWSPTFRADIATLNAPLCIALSRINQSLARGERPESFVLQRQENFEIREIKLQSK